MRDFLHHLFIPRASNKHRSKLLHHDALFLAIAVLFAGFIFIQGMHREYPAVLGDAASVTVDDLLKYTNLQRQINGLPALKLNNDLNHAAQMKGKDMFAKDYWAHVSPDGTTPWVFIKNSGYNYQYAGENLARGYDTSTSVVDAWMHSVEHRDNLLSPHYTDIGFSVQTGTLVGYNTVLVVQEFGSPYAVGGDSASTGQVPPYAASNASEPKEALMGDIKKPTIDLSAAKSSSQPLVDLTSLKRNISFFFILFFIAVLALDALIIERKNIVRAFSHNLDHMFFFAFILLAGILIGRGFIL
ncbi:MAG: CAP domain-containing protein [Candidatus Levyibacteriota bacterium]